MSRLQLPVVSEGAEHLVMGYLMRRNILTYKAPPRNEGYDLVCVNPQLRYKPKSNEKSKVLIQVKSRFATDAGKGFPMKEKSLDAFDYLVVAFMNIGRFGGGRDGSEGSAPPEFYTFPAEMVRGAHKGYEAWAGVRLSRMNADLEPYRGDAGFELIARDLGVEKPVRFLSSE